jgi:cytochrome b6
MSLPPKVAKRGRAERSIPFVPDFLLRDMVGWLTALMVLAAVAAFFPAELGEKADPFAPAPEGIRPEWYFMFMFQTLKYLPARILGIEGELVGVLAFGLGAVILVLVPFLDRKTARGEESSLWRNLALLALLYIFLLTWLGYTANPAV